MRQSLALFILLAHFVTVPATAADLLQGTVVSIDRKGGRLILRQADTQKNVDVVILPDLVPGFLKAGDRITAWGQYIQRDPDVFQARKITRDRSREPGNDPTGVRSRLK
ncbi:MAG: hypothetical protein ABII68_08875 [Pseudomonadota bacterium]